MRVSHCTKQEERAKMANDEKLPIVLLEKKLTEPKAELEDLSRNY
jgi:hypothetical protein